MKAVLIMTFLKKVFFKVQAAQSCPMRIAPKSGGKAS